MSVSILSVYSAVGVTSVFRVLSGGECVSGDLSV